MDCVNECSLPGWKIEQKYSNKVLIGNWFDDRKQFTRSHASTFNSCYQKDFVPFPDFKPDGKLSRLHKKKMEGYPKQVLFCPHGKPKNKHLISNYDDDFERHGNSTLPTFRSWNRNCLTWTPEHSDYPSEDPPTNFGLLQKMEKQWREQPNNLRSVYSASYKPHPPADFAFVRYGVAPRILSSNLYRHNNLNKNLYLKGCRHLQVPDFPVERITKQNPFIVSKN
ncbi:cilia- and flagella-associated protein 107 [Rhinophrynus dorsalis]